MKKLSLVIALLLIVGWVFAGSGITLEKILALLQAILNIVYFPMDSVIAWIGKLLTKQS